jgi:hypothetical protein
MQHTTVKHRMKHLAYSAGWKKFERMWGTLIHLRRLADARPLLEAILAPVRGTPQERECVPDGRAAAPTFGPSR